jgi:hypothetical protein
MGGVTGDESDLTFFAAPDNGKIGGLHDFSAYYFVMKLLAASHDVNVIAVAQIVNVPKESIAMSSDDSISRRAWNCRARHVPRAQEQRMFRRAFHDYYLHINAGNGKLG